MCVPFWVRLLALYFNYSGGSCLIHVDTEGCAELISTAGSALGITELLTDEYCQELYRESDGHPYVIKILLGDIARRRQRTKVKRIIAGQDTLLTALFERTYSMLSPASQRVFLTLCKWRSTIPEIALEAVLLRPQNERINFRDAVHEVVQSSFVEEITVDNDDIVLDVPLAAWLFGKRKLEVSPWKAAVVADGELLRLLGVGRKTDAKHGVNARLERLFKTAAAGIISQDHEIEELKPVLEFIARSYPLGWLLLADLHNEEGPAHDLEACKACVQSYLENPKGDVEVSRVWKRLADFCRDTQDVLGEIHALAAMCKAHSVPTHVVSNAANRINQTLREGNANVPAEELRVLLTEVIGEMERRSPELTSDDCSRLSWLYLHVQDQENAIRVAERGLELDSANPHCAGLVEKLSAQ